MSRNKKLFLVHWQRPIANKCALFFDRHLAHKSHCKFNLRTLYYTQFYSFFFIINFLIIILIVYSQMILSWAFKLLYRMNENYSSFFRSLLGILLIYNIKILVYKQINEEQTFLKVKRQENNFSRIRGPFLGIYVYLTFENGAKSYLIVTIHKMKKI